MCWAAPFSSNLTGLSAGWMGLALQAYPGLYPADGRAEMLEYLEQPVSDDDDAKGQSGRLSAQQTLLGKKVGTKDKISAACWPS